MSVILILLIVLAIIVVLIAATLLIPVDISIRLSKEGPLAQGWLSFALLMGTASGRIDFSPEKREFLLQVLGITLLKRPLEKREKKTKDEKQREEKHPDWTKVILNANELYAAGKELARALTKSLSIKRLGGRVKVGLSNPAQTGMLVGFLYAGSGIAKAFLPETSLEIEPSFEEELMDADLELRLSLPLFKTVIPLIRFFRSTRKVF
jgi:hypothetical protein